jgi:hypothetical protein
MRSGCGEQRNGEPWVTAFAGKAAGGQRKWDGLEIRDGRQMKIKNGFRVTGFAGLRNERMNIRMCG